MNRTFVWSGIPSVKVELEAQFLGSRTPKQTEVRAQGNGAERGSGKVRAIQICLLHVGCTVSSHESIFQDYDLEEREEKALPPVGALAPEGLIPWALNFPTFCPGSYRLCQGS